MTPSLYPVLTCLITLAVTENLWNSVLLHPVSYRKTLCSNIARSFRRYLACINIVVPFLSFYTQVCCSHDQVNHNNFQSKYIFLFSYIGFTKYLLQHSFQSSFSPPSMLFSDSLCVKEFQRNSLNIFTYHKIYFHIDYLIPVANCLLTVPEVRQYVTPCNL